MVLVSASRIQVRKKRYLISFLFKSLRIGHQMKKTPGFLGGRLIREGGGRFWTCTLWTDYAAMDAFRNSGHHLDAMKRHLVWTEELVHGHWEQEDPTFPTLRGLHERLARNAHFTKLEHGTDFQRERAVPGFVAGAPVRVIELEPRDIRNGR